MPQAGELRVRLLGGFEATVDGRVVGAAAWRRRKAATVVKLLALARGHRLHREQLQDYLWPDLHPRAAANNLHRTLHAARRVLEPGLARAASGRYLRMHNDTIDLCSAGALWVDAAAFEAAAVAARRARTPTVYEAAVGLYTGELLPEDRFADWAGARREALRALYLALLLEAAALHETHGEAGAAGVILERAIAEEPEHEPAHAALMRLYAAEQPSRALRQYEHLREALRQRLGTEPGAPTRRLYETIRDGQRAAAERSGSEVARSSSHPEGPDGAGGVRAAAVGATNLPHPLTGFVGRERELGEVERLLRDHRLVTLTGPGGGGKTRLALHVAGAVVAGRARRIPVPDGVWVVELAPLADPRRVPQTVAAVLGLREAPDQPAVEALAAWLRSKRLLLVLDNVEHLVDACARLADAVLRACPGVRVLTTGREPLRLVGEVRYLVPPLAAPDPQRLPAPGAEVVAAVSRYEAVRLFLDRVRARRPGFTLTATSAVAVARVCHRLDGLPLALELAAVHAGTLSVEAVADRLDDALRLLVRGDRAAPPRQRTLRDTLDWSYALLDASEQALLRRLAVFAGGWTTAAAAAVCGAAGQGVADDLPPSEDAGPRGSAEETALLDRLTGLVEKSLVVAPVTGAPTGPGRYHLLETVRQYALERLRDAGEEQVVRRRHAAWCLALAEAAVPALAGEEQAIWLDRLTAEHDNLRAALRWLAAGEPGGAMPDAAGAMRLVAALWRFWRSRGHWAEGRDWLETVARLPGQVPAAIKARVLSGAGIMARSQGDYAAARAHHEASLALLAEAGDRRELPSALTNLAAVLLAQGQGGRARALFEEALGLFRDQQDRRGTAYALHNLGRLALQQGDAPGAVAHFRESLPLFRALGDAEGVAISLHNLATASLEADDAAAAALCEESLTRFRELGNAHGAACVRVRQARLALRRGDSEGAQTLYAEGLARLWELGDQRVVAECLEGLAAATVARGESERAARLLGAAGALRSAINAPCSLSERADIGRTADAVTAGLGTGLTEALRTAGRAMPPEQAVRYALQGALTPLAQS